MRTQQVLLMLVLLGAPAVLRGECDQSLESFFTDLANAAERGDKAGYTRSFLPDAKIFLPRRQPIVGQDQIGSWFDEFRRTVSLVLDKYEQVEVDVVGEVAMVRSRGIGQHIVKSTNEQLSFDQKYLDVVACVDGQWLLAYHVASSSSLDDGLWDRNWEQQ